MGKKGDPMAVMPAVLGGHTPMPAYSIGEKCADLIKETWRMDDCRI